MNEHNTNKRNNENNKNEYKRIEKEVCRLKSDLGLFYDYDINKIPEKYYNLFNRDNFYPNNDEYKLYNLEMYNKYLKGNNDLMKKSWLIAIDNGNIDSMIRTGVNYISTKENKIHYIKYLSDAADNGSEDAMLRLSHYYKRDTNNYGLAKKYLLMAIEKGNIRAMVKLGKQYSNRFNSREDELAEKYYLMAIDKRSVHAMLLLAQKYDREKKYDLAKKYYLMTIEYNARSDGYIYDSSKKESDLNCAVGSIIFCYVMSPPYDYELRTYILSLIDVNYFTDNEKIGQALPFGQETYNILCELYNVYCDKYVQNITTGGYKPNIEGVTSSIIEYFNNKYSQKTDNMEYIMKSLGKIYYGHSKKKLEYKKFIIKTFMIYASQIYMEYLDIHYYEYLKKIFAPGKKGYIKTKKHFEQHCENHKSLK